jgi:hypothetical protein
MILKFKGHDTLYLFTDCRSIKPPSMKEIANKIHYFPYEIEGHDYGKLYHLELLLQLSKMKNLKGIIGNTSGYLDLAGFLGHHVLNLHQFHDKINYQSYRVFLQSSFLIIEDFNTNLITNTLKDKDRHWIDFTEEVMKENMPIVADWINTIQNTPTFPIQKLNNAKIQNTGLVDLHQILAWEGNEFKTTSTLTFNQLVKELKIEIDKFQKR